MQPINKSLTELLKEGYELMEDFSKNLQIYCKGKERIFYDKANQQILWQYQSDYDSRKEK